MGPGRSPGKFGFWSIFEPQKSRQNGQLAFKSGRGATSESGARAPLPQRRSAPVNNLAKLCQILIQVLACNIRRHSAITPVFNLSNIPILVTLFCYYS